VCHWVGVEALHDGRLDIASAVHGLSINGITTSAAEVAEDFISRFRRFYMVGIMVSHVGILLECTRVAYSYHSIWEDLTTFGHKREKNAHL
jgi:hypothetical protein